MAGRKQIGARGLAGLEREEMDMSSADDEARIRQLHGRYIDTLGSGDLNALVEHFTFPAVFKGFLDDVTTVSDGASLASTYEKLIAAAPKAARTEVLSLDAARLRPGVHMLTMHYEQYGADDQLIHAGRALYLAKEVGSELKLFAVL
jgi:hypothetical protein